MALDAEQVLESEGHGASLDSQDETGFNVVTVVGGVAVTAEPLHPGNDRMREWMNGRF